MKYVLLMLGAPFFMGVMLAITNLIKEIAFNINKSRKSKIEESTLSDEMFNCFCYCFVAAIPIVNLGLILTLTMRLLGFTDKSKNIS